MSLNKPRQTDKPNNQFLKRISGVVHVGANVGQEAGLYRHFDLDVIWIEPMPKIFAILNDKLKNKIFSKQRAFKALITDVDNKEYKFNISNYIGASSILKLKDVRNLGIPIKYIDSFTINSITLNSLFVKEKIDIKKYQALVLDTQGSELLVLKGSLPILHIFKYIKVEVANFESYENCCQLSDIENFMAEYGYKMTSSNKDIDATKGNSYFDIVYTKLPNG